MFLLKLSRGKGKTDSFIRYMKLWDRREIVSISSSGLLQDFVAKVLKAESGPKQITRHEFGREDCRAA
jgi:hypothetical protein